MNEDAKQTIKNFARRNGMSYKKVKKLFSKLSDDEKSDHIKWMKSQQKQAISQIDIK